ncbi:hypothetical protein IGB42_01306 [Andreprevotia sp. IGB-42]|uniref:hypothetical protein n=1 Tax=Andreprevotia sp. IGB-42 TaxID=2497473 RepID=UPI00135C2282|nr:hypothetical protein [Andreprevotia sp. IGB-42]KAF0814405.1 hypothetical protein IGB42_01306 [Andreprevotia sp. IGB-42]
MNPRRASLFKTGLPLWLEITLIICIKLCLLWGAKQLWFSKPLTHSHQMSVSQDAISRQILGVTTASAAAHQTLNTPGETP